MGFSYLAHEKLLSSFDSVFRGNIYKHRDQSLGNWIAAHLYEDILQLASSQKFVARVTAGTRVRHKDVRVVGSKGRRGDGAFGEILPGAMPASVEGFTVKRGPVARVEIGAETKILAKAMNKQIDRVIGDLNRQVVEFNLSGGKPLCVAFIGVNHAETYVSFEGERSFPTDGKKHKHPIQEASKAIINLSVVTGYDEVLIMPFRATNCAPFDFEWVNFERTRQQYAAVLLRLSKDYEARF